MRAEIVSVGTELLMGQTVNTNAQYISKALTNLGIDIFYISTVGDNAERLSETIKTALGRSDIIITTGGLGPTPDDITKEVVAEALGMPLVFNEECMAEIEKIFSSTGREMPPNNQKQAYFPENCIIMPNPRGTAPGCIIEKNGKTAIILPGPPYEMNLMFDNHVLPYLKTKSEGIIVSHFIKVFGLGESFVADKISDLIEKQTVPTVATYCSTCEVHIRLSAKCKYADEAEELIKPIEDEIVKRFGSAVYTIGEDTLEEVVAKMLVQSNKRLALAESCTGGLITSMLTDIPGSSKYLIEGIVAYSNDSKVNRLGIPKSLIQDCGAVSHEVAVAMSKGVLKTSGADISVAVTGIAGPDGGTIEKPVGTVFIAVSDNDSTDCKQYSFRGNRERIRQLSALSALNLLRLKLQEY